MRTVELEIAPPFIRLRAPYNAAFIAALKVTIPWTARKWVPGTRVWEIDANLEAAVLRICKLYFDEVLRVTPQAKEQNSMPGDPWSVLHLRPGAPAEVIEAVYRALARKWHPDLWPEQERPMANAKMSAINQAIDKVRTGK